MPDHYLLEVIRKVDETHKGLGKLVAMEMLAVKAKKALIVISPSGTGKSTASYFVAQHCQIAKYYDRLTVAGMRRLKDELTGFQGLIVIDDLSKARSSHVLINTLCGLTELCYSHFLSSQTAWEGYSIENFNGSVIFNIQPILFAKVVREAEYETSVRDKAIRYYHLFRPVKPNQDLPPMKLNWGIDIKNVTREEIKDFNTDKLMRIFMLQFGESRAIQHLTALLRATAALDRSRTVRDIDCEVLYEIMKQTYVEKYALSRQQLEGEIKFNRNFYYLLVEFATHGEFTLDQICQTYKVSQATARYWLDSLQPFWTISSKSPTKYKPSEEMRKILSEVV